MKYVARVLLVSACLLAQPVAQSVAGDEHDCGSVSVSPVIDSQDEWRFRITLNGDVSPGKDTGAREKVRVQTLLQVTFKKSDGSKKSAEELVQGQSHQTLLVLVSGISPAKGDRL